MEQKRGYLVRLYRSFAVATKPMVEREGAVDAGGTVSPRVVEGIPPTTGSSQVSHDHLEDTCVATTDLHPGRGACPAPLVRRDPLTTTAEERLTRLGIELPPVPPPVANFIRARQVGDLLFLSGHGPIRPDGSRVVGKVGTDLSIDEGRAAARLTGLNLLATARAHLGSLDRVRAVVKVLGMVNSGPGFDRQPEVVDGFSDLMVEVFGEDGRHARSAVGMAELPFGIPVEIEMIIEVVGA